MGEQAVRDMAGKFGIAARRLNGKGGQWALSRGGANMVVYEIEPTESAMQISHECLLDCEKTHYAKEVKQFPLSELSPQESDVFVLVNYAAMVLLEKGVKPDGTSLCTAKDGVLHCGVARVYWEPLFEQNKDDAPVAAIVPVSEYKRFVGV